MRKNRPVTLVVQVVCFLILTAVTCIGPPAVQAYPTIPAVEVMELPAMPLGSYVSGRDNCGSYSLWGQSIFCFGDTALTQANSEGVSWINNSMYHTTDTNGDDGIGGGFNYKTSGQPANQWVPNTAAEVAYNNSHDDKYVIWSGTFFTDPNTSKVYLWFGKVHLQGTQYLSGGGSGFAEVTSLTLQCTRIQHRPGNAEDYLMFDQGERAGGMSVVTGGYLYTLTVDGGVYGTVYAARAPMASEGFKTRSNWRFWNGTSWDTNAANAASVTGGMGGGSIAWNSYLNCWLYTCMEWVGDKMIMKVADNLTGPWSDARILYVGKHGPNNETPYSGQAYPMLQKESGRTQYTSYCIPMVAGSQSIPMVRTRFYTPVTTPTLNTWYAVVAKHSGKSIDVQWGGTGDGVNIWQYSTTGNYAQIWMLEDAGGGYIKIKNRNSGKYIDVEGYGTANGSNVWQYSYLGGTNQQWQLVNKGGGYFAIKGRASGRVIDVSGVSTADQANVYIWDDVNGANQQFAFTAP